MYYSSSPSLYYTYTYTCLFITLLLTLALPLSAFSCPVFILSVEKNLSPCLGNFVCSVSSCLQVKLLTLICLHLNIHPALDIQTGALADCPTIDGQTCNPHHPFAKMMHADPCFPTRGEIDFRALTSSSSILLHLPFCSLIFFFLFFFPLPLSSVFLPFFSSFFHFLFVLPSSFVFFPCCTAQYMFVIKGKFRCLGAAGSFQTMECDCSVEDCGCSTGPALTTCNSRVRMGGVVAGFNFILGASC